MSEIKTEQPAAQGKELTLEQTRVLGCLIEKSATTPDQYPLTLNSLKLACNQKTSRFPVVNYDDHTVRTTLRELEAKGYVEEVNWSDSRVAKYKHKTAMKLDVSSQDIAVLCVLMLRGPQTLNEIKTRTQRIHEFESNADVERICQRLTDRDPTLVQLLARQTGEKEARYQQLFGDELDAPAPSISSSSARSSSSELVEKVESLTAEVNELKTRIETLESLMQ